MTHVMRVATQRSGRRRDGVAGVCQGDPLLRLQATAGNAAVTRLLVPVQRNVGFEFECPGWYVEQLTQPLNSQQEGGTAFVPVAQLSTDGLKKGSVIATGRDFELQVDEGSGVPPAGSKQDYHLEFVTTGAGFPETSDGRAQLKRSMSSLDDMATGVVEGMKASAVSRGGLPPAGFRVMPSARLKGHVLDDAIIHAGGTLAAEPQVTAGVRLDQIGPMLESLEKRRPSESDQEWGRRDELKASLFGKSAGGEQALLAASPGEVRNAVGRLRTRVGRNDIGSQDLVGMVSIIRSYLKKGEAKIGAYPKTLAPLLARTDFGSMFKMLPEPDLTYFRTWPQYFVDLALDAAGLAAGAALPVFAGGIDIWGIPQQQGAWISQHLQVVTRQAWLTGMVSGTDLLTKANFPGWWGDYLESMGSLGSAADTVGKKRRKGSTETKGAVIEFRRLRGGQRYDTWAASALQIFDYFAALNDKQRPWEA